MPDITNFVKPVEGVRGKQRISENKPELAITLYALREGKLKPSTYMLKVLLRDEWIIEKDAPKVELKEGEKRPRGGARKIYVLTAAGKKWADKAEELNPEGLKQILKDGKRTLNHRAQARVLDTPAEKKAKEPKAPKAKAEKAPAKKAEAKKAPAKTTSKAREAIQKAKAGKQAPAKEQAVA